MAWDKPAPELIGRFERWLPKDEQVRRRKMFGCPCAFVNGNMFVGVYQQNLVVRLPETRRNQLIAAKRAKPFTVMGRTMHEYVLLDRPLDRDEADLAALIAEAFAYAGALAPKIPRPRKTPTPKQAASRGKPGARARR
jgi:TfoX/Sxy family transcriptional regulator of competence genes